MNLKENLAILNEFHLGMFEYGDAPDTFLTNFLEYYYIKFGRVAAWRVTKEAESPGFPVGSLIVTTCTLANKLTPYGEGSEVICTTRNGCSITFDRYSDDVAVGFNNLSELPCMDIKSDASALAEVDTSLRFLTFWTRLAPVIRCADEPEKQALIAAFKNIQEGVPVTLVSRKILKDLGLGDNYSIDDLTRPDFADKIQYTARLREDLLRWHYTRYGQVVQGDTKLAQQSVDEVNGTVSSSLVIPLNMLKARRAFIDEVNRKFGTNITVDLAGPWRGEITKYENDTGEGEIDNTTPELNQDNTEQNATDTDTDPKEGGESNDVNG